MRKLYVCFDPTSVRKNPSKWNVKTKVDQIRFLFKGSVTERFANYLAFLQVKAILEALIVVPMDGTITVNFSNLEERISGRVTAFSIDAVNIIRCTEIKVLESLSLLGKCCQTEDNFSLAIKYVYEVTRHKPNPLRG